MVLGQIVVQIMQSGVKIIVLLQQVFHYFIALRIQPKLIKIFNFTPERL